MVSLSALSFANLRFLSDDKSASFTREQVGTEEGGWLSFQPLYQMITKEQPDLLD